MAAFSRKIYKTIEWHFYHFGEVKQQAEMDREDIFGAANYAIEASGIRGTDTSDKTGNTVLRLEESQANADWCAVVEATVERYRDSPLGMLINMIYVEKQGVYRICDKMSIDRSTLYNWKEEIVTYAALKACEKNLINI